MVRGIYAPIPTPFSDQELAFDRLAENLARWEETELTGYVVLGSNGEFVYLSTGEKRAMIDFVAEHRGSKEIIAGTGAESTRETIELCRAAGAAGYRAALVVNPDYYKGNMTDAVLKAHYEAVADASPIPVMLYNMPRNTGINLGTKLVCDLAQHPNIVGLKDSGGNIVQISEIVAGTPDDFAVFAGSGSFLYTALMVGAVGGTLAVANILPNECARIHRLVEEDRYDEARQLQLAILKINAAVTGRFGVPGLKAAMDLLGYYGGECRLPLLPAPASAVEEIKGLLAELGYGV